MSLTDSLQIGPSKESHRDDWYFPTSCHLAAPVKRSRFALVAVRLSAVYSGEVKKLYILLATIVVAVAVALTYYYFEYAVHHSITYIWDTWLNTGTQRLLIIPLCLAVSLMFFKLQHYFDPDSEHHQSHGLGEAPSPTVANFIKVLGIGFFSLVAGASLGPEAILVPACLVIGAYAGTKLFKADKQMVGLLSMVGFVALFAAFFNSFIAGMLGLLLVSKKVKVKLDPALVIIAAVASLVTVGVLHLLSSKAYVTLPPASYKFPLLGVVLVVILFAGGYATTYGLLGVNKLAQPLHKAVASRPWWARATVAAIGLSILYLLGGPLVEFTGNESIVPMLHQSASLGVLGLIWIFIIKLFAIGWSKTIGYRGGLVFPSVFVASVLVAISHLFTQDIGFTLGLVAVMAGILVSDRKLDILF